MAFSSGHALNYSSSIKIRTSQCTKWIFEQNELLHFYIWPENIWHLNVSKRFSSFVTQKPLKVGSTLQIAEPITFAYELII